ncbi:MAG: NAD(P)H-binding protein [Chromatiaceae bacterium]|nr:NAD(P)H-binding protein [Chromatiaceae bacterium]MBP8290577.1 NAD(P)H-binding protein [Chromatiaceae bacterium]
MKVSLIGGTGFVGSHIVPALIAAGHVPRLLMRHPESGHGLPLDHCEVVLGDVEDLAAVIQCVTGADAVIYLIGILREFPARGISFEGLQSRGVALTLSACNLKGVGRFLLMSANGVKPDGTAYQRTKFQAEEAVKASGLRWTIFRPSVIFGRPQGRMEFCTQLRRDIIDSPLPAPLFYPGLLPMGAGGFQLAPVAVEDVAQAFVRALDKPETEGRSLELCGPEPKSWREILETIAAAVGKRKMMLPAPALGVRTAAALFDRFPWFPITRDQITMLLEGNVCADASAYPLLGIQPQAFTVANLSYLNEG